MTAKRALLSAVILVVLALAGWGWWRGIEAARQSRRELAELQARRAQLEIATARLRREVASLKRDKETRARAARETLDVAAPGEVLVVVATPTRTP